MQVSCDRAPLVVSRCSIPFGEGDALPLHQRRHLHVVDSDD